LFLLLFITAMLDSEHLESISESVDVTTQFSDRAAYGGENPESSGISHDTEPEVADSREASDAEMKTNVDDSVIVEPDLMSNCYQWQQIVDADVIEV